MARKKCGRYNFQKKCLLILIRQAFIEMTLKKIIFEYVNVFYDFRSEKAH